MSSATFSLKAGSDRKLLLWTVVAAVAIIIVVTLVASTDRREETRPLTTNPGPTGAKAAYLTLQALGRAPRVWDAPLSELKQLDAAHATLILAAPAFTRQQLPDLRDSLHNFLDSGGRVIVTGGAGAALLDQTVARPGDISGGLCYAQPDGPGPFSIVGKVEMNDTAAWPVTDPSAEVRMRCGDDAVVVTRQVGRGTAVWWSNATPLSNSELHNAANLHLLLASVGEGRAAYFDDELALGNMAPPQDPTQGLPLTQLRWQMAALFVLIVFSFSRRRGPVRALAGVPRSSPVEFVTSMGDLYRKAGALEPVMAAARRNLLRTLARDAGLPTPTLQLPPGQIAHALTERLGGDWSHLAAHLAQTGHHNLTESHTLTLVHHLREDAEAVRTAAGRRSDPASTPPRIRRTA